MSESRGPLPRAPEASLAPDARFEPVHLHGVNDTSLHLMLSPDRGRRLTDLVWAEPCRFGDFGTEVLIDGPRDDAELTVVLAIIPESIAWAVGAPGVLWRPVCRQRERTRTRTHAHRAQRRACLTLTAPSPRVA